ncbi:MAG: zinc ABC transporter substrate-binding protein [Candidatus Poribacteria bacterium]|nr:zinc ABC transporter substrate-binding protein [Candidatus Poribacteria bacterium]
MLKTSISLSKTLTQDLKAFILLIHKIGFSLCLIAFLTCIGCDPKNAPDAPDTSGKEKIRVVTTIGMITDIVKNVGGDQVEVIGMMGHGVDPHLYKPTFKDVQRLKTAHIVFYNGLHLEAKMAEVLADMPGDVKTVAVAENVDQNLLLSHPEYEGQYDPHLWFDVKLWMKAVEKVRDTLSTLDPESEKVYQNNTKRYLAELSDLHQYVKTQAERVQSQQRVLVTAHDAFNYFGKTYGFEVRGLQGISTSMEAGIADVQELATFIAERRIPAIFVESSVSSRSLEAVKAAVKSKGFNVQIGGELFSDAMGSEGTPEGTYIGMVRHNIDTIVKALTRETTATEEN